MTTLADMTPQERAQCQGMWGEHTFWGLVLISITDGVIFRGVNVEVIRFIDGRPMREWASTSEVTPRPDLPRAWNPDGTPPAGQWDYAEYLGDYKGMTDVYHYDGDPTHRRWVGKWEEA